MPAYRFRWPLRTAAAAVLTTLALTAAGGVTATSAAPEPAPGGAAAASTLVKTAQNVTDPGNFPVDHGATVNWTVAYANDTPGAPAPAVITDPIDGAGTAQTYVPGSLKVPPGWTPGWSTDGTTFTSSDPGTATRAVRASHPAARLGGTAHANILLPPVRPTAQSTGGDGFTPVLHRTDSGEVEAWNMYHHTGPAAPQAVCSNLSTGQPCAGGPWPRPLNTTPGPLGSGSTGNISSTLTPQYVLDPDRPGVLYYPAVTASALGVGCLDLDARANCGFFALRATGGTPSSANGMAGLVAEAGNLYAVASTGQVLCLDIDSRTPCAGQPYAPVVRPNHDLPGATGSLYLGGMTTADGKVFASSSPQGSGSTVADAPALGCFDPATSTVCAGWDTAHPAGPGAAHYTYNAFTSYAPTGAANGVCTAASNSGSPLTTCYGIDGAPLAAPATGLGTVGNGVLVFNPEVVTTATDTRSYFPVWGGPVAGATLCYSWTTAQPCAGFPATATHPGVGGGATRDYGYTYDATTRCLIALGDAGILFSLDPGTGATPCVHTGAAVTLNPSDFYCDGPSGHVQGYTEARLEAIDLSHVDLAASAVSVTDPDGTVLAAPALTPTGTVDLSGISAADHPAITVTVQLVLTSTADFTDTNHPLLVASYRGDAPQICLRTVVGADCSVTKVSDTATATDASGSLISNTVDVAVAPGAACKPKVTVNKEICTVSSPHACGPGGAGPWAKKSPVGLLQLLGTAYWRITVTNTGAVAATGVTVNDPTTPGCQTAAGTFGLAVGASREIHCSSFLLALPLKNTASATFSAVNAPPGTPPTTSAPSSAIACSLLCILAKES
ncbi:hypothetical protein PUR59_01790 [Streptomyces sp. SP18ES09]|uniref:DUF7617 domain-containing protein n=1 Tax=Streptomyces sp. SP18ES09 TaxID=3002532 RepID=UPI002E76DF10|nr:hypothetical protein [Streptomyces sp. SP18ES09]MEE1813772.1 hypothetical protein [Streptomyces sp. SP18ES09]